MSEDGWMTEAEVEEWFQEWSKTPGIVKTLQDINNRRELTQTMFRLAGVWQ